MPATACPRKTPFWYGAKAHSWQEEKSR
uniref:Uncharacterized protein n=1 Tax=Anguilla anguilla TaxID=7936 RepID=A0A0E9QUQ3_ANGAN